MLEKGYKIFVVFDNMFVNVLFGGGLDLKSSDNFSFYIFEIIVICLEVGMEIGLRFEFNC